MPRRWSQRPQRQHRHAFSQLSLLARQSESFPRNQGHFLIDESVQDISLVVAKRDPRAESLQALYASSQRPQRWHLSLIRNFMLLIGPLSSLYNFLTFLF
jgi:hypothetical protein